jgi:hypothetical protein
MYVPLLFFLFRSVEKGSALEKGQTAQCGIESFGSYRGGLLMARPLRIEYSDLSNEKAGGHDRQAERASSLEVPPIP